MRKGPGFMRDEFQSPQGWGGSNLVFPNALAVNKAGDIVITGQLYGPSDLGGGLTSGGGMFVAKYSGLNGNYQWAKTLGGTTGNGITTDPTTGNVIVTGGFQGAVDFGGGALTSGSGGAATSMFLAGYGP